MSTKPAQNFNIFYSWQSDRSRNFNNDFIKKCLQKAIKEISKDDTVKIIPRIEHDTKGDAGSPKIIDTILNKIDAANIMVADLTIIHPKYIETLLHNRITPNPNVLFELGYAVNRLGWERIICLNNTSFSKIKDMPFDIQQHRITNFSFCRRSNKSEAEKELISILKNAIKTIIKKYDLILSKQNQQSILHHDKEIFEKLNRIIGESTLLVLLDEINNLQLISKMDLKTIQKYAKMIVAPSNQFLTSSLKSQAINLSQSINSMINEMSIAYIAEFNENSDDSAKEISVEMTYRLPPYDKYFESYEKYQEITDKKAERVSKAVKKTLENYNEFRTSIKQALFI